MLGLSNTGRWTLTRYSAALIGFVLGAALMVGIDQADARDNDKTTGSATGDANHDSKKETAARLDAQYETAVRTWDAFNEKWGPEADISNEDTYADYTHARDMQNSYRDGFFEAHQAGSIQTKGAKAYQEKFFQ
jgi:hypothetical protein